MMRSRAFVDVCPMCTWDRRNCRRFYLWTRHYGGVRVCVCRSQTFVPPSPDRGRLPPRRRQPVVRSAAFSREILLKNEIINRLSSVFFSFFFCYLLLFYFTLVHTPPRYRFVFNFAFQLHYARQYYYYRACVRRAQSNTTNVYTALRGKTQHSGHRGPRAFNTLI